MSTLAQNVNIELLESSQQLRKMPKKVIVTGGTGLVGSAIRKVIEQEAPKDEEWIFCSSKDANLW